MTTTTTTTTTTTQNATTILFLYGVDPTTGERVEFEGTADEAIAYATDHRIALDGCLSDDPETQAAQGVKFKVTAAGEWRWV